MALAGVVGTLACALEDGVDGRTRVWGARTSPRRNGVVWAAGGGAGGGVMLMMARGGRKVGRTLEDERMVVV